MILALLLITLAWFQNAHAWAYIGCFDVDHVLEGLPGEYIYSGENPPTIDCDCRARGYDYSYTYGDYGGDVGIYESCYCSNSPPNYAYILNYAEENCAYGVGGQGGNVRVTLTHPKPVGWEQKDCYLPPSPGKAGTGVYSLVECLAICAPQSPYAVLIAREGNSIAKCACYQDQTYWQNLPSRECDPETWHVFSAAVQPSSVVRRKERSLNRQTSELCPAGTTACLLDQSGHNGFECIDTSSELESCSGCAIGEFTTKSRLTKKSNGIKCSALPGVLPDGVTCYEGRCVAFACEDGFTLVNDACVPQWES